MDHCPLQHHANVVEGSLFPKEFKHEKGFLCWSKIVGLCRVISISAGLLLYGGTYYRANKKSKISSNKIGILESGEIHECAGGDVKAIRKRFKEGLIKIRCDFYLVEKTFSILYVFNWWCVKACNLIYVSNILPF